MCVLKKFDLAMNIENGSKSESKTRNRVSSVVAKQHCALSKKEELDK